MAVPGLVSVVPPQPMTVKTMAINANSNVAVPRQRRRGRPIRSRQARLAPPPASHPGMPLRVLTWGCAGVVFTVSEACPVPVIDLGFTKQADCASVDGMVQVRVMGVV